jgi:transposase
VAQERLSVRKIREILRLRADGFSEREIASSVGVARSSIQICLWRAERAGIGWPIPEGLDDRALEERLYPRPKPGVEVHPTPDFDWIERELKRKHVTRRQLWREYLAQNPDGLKYTAFCVKYRRWRATRGVTMSLTHIPGDRLFVDYAGDPVLYTDPATGIVQKAWIFVAVWAYSSLMYAEATRTQKSPDWLGAHVRALEAFGVAPRAITPDNCKTAVDKARRYDPEFNRSYSDFAQTYRLAVLPARVRRPRDKAGGEQGVLLAERAVLGGLRNMKFFSVAEINAAIGKLLIEINTAAFQKREGCRQSVFDAEERAVAQSLPAHRYEYTEWKLRAKVHLDHHIEFDKAYYSVHYSLIGERVDVCGIGGIVNLFLRGGLIATHVRATHRYQRRTIEAHRPPEHQAYRALGIDLLIERALKVGPATHEILQRQLARKRHPGEVIREALGLLRLARDFDTTRLEQTCAEALELGLHGFRAINDLIKRPGKPLHKPARSVIGMHANVRGAEYFQPPLIPQES